jgi:hypothetical protein
VERFCFQQDLFFRCTASSARFPESIFTALNSFLSGFHTLFDQRKAFILDFICQSGTGNIP